MTRNTATQLSKQIATDAPACRVTGLRDHGGNSYALSVTDTRTGVQFTVHSLEEWQERVALAAVDWSTLA